MKRVIDNFDFFVNTMDESENNFYWLCVLRRVKDLKEKKDYPEFYYKNTYYIYETLIKTKKQLVDIKDKIISLCEENDARAYISLNSHDIDFFENLKAVNVSTKFIYNPEKKKYVKESNEHKSFTLYTTYTKYNSSDDEIKALIDIDANEKEVTKNNKNLWSSVKSVLTKNKIKILYEFVSPKNGLSILIKSINKDLFSKLSDKFKEYDDNKKNHKVSILSNPILLLYSNLDTISY